MRIQGLYVVTDGRLTQRSHIEQAWSAYAGGADVVQLRDKDNPKDQVVKEALAISAVAKRYERIFIVNDDLEIALRSEASGVHLGKTDGSISEARKDSPDGFIIGASVESVDDALEAERQGADYVALSPVFDTTTKSDAHPGYGLKMLSDIKHNVSIPVFAIGGINLNNARDVMDAGADGIAVVSAIIAQKDIEDATKKMKERIIASKGRR